MPGDDKDLLKIDEHTVWIPLSGVARTLRYENLDGSGAPVGAYISPILSNPPAVYVCPQDRCRSRLRRPRASAQKSPAWIPTWRSSTSIPCPKRIDISLSSRRTSMLWPTPSVNRLFLHGSHLRRAGVSGRPAHSRNWYSCRARQHPGRHSQVGVAGGVPTRCHRNVFGIVGAISLQKAVASESLRCPAARSACISKRHGLARAHCTGCVRPSLRVAQCASNP